MSLVKGITAEKILTVLKTNNIEYIADGPNVKKNNVNVKCPFCENDPSQHMGISLINGEYACWRDSKHRGKNFLTLLQEILDCSLDEAKRQLGLKTLEPNEFDNILSRLYEVEIFTPRKLGGAKSLVFDKSFREIKETGITAPFWDYFLRRGFDNVDKLLRLYEIKCCLIGYWRYRIIFPIRYNGELVSWVGRSISPNATLKYLDLSVERSVRHPKFCIWNYDELLNGGHTLFITEGIFDAVKLDCYFPVGYKATCLFTKTIRDEQKSLLQDLSKVFDQLILLLDADAVTQSWAIASELAYLRNVKSGLLPDGIKDPGDLTKNQVLKLIR